MRNLLALLLLISGMAGCGHSGGESTGTTTPVPAFEGDLSGAERDPEVPNLFYKNCVPDQIETLRHAVKFMRAAAKSYQFQHCLHSAITVRQRAVLTFQEALAVGAYRTCKPGPTGDQDFQEPSFVYTSPELGFEAALRVSQNLNPLLLVCTSNAQQTATSGPEYEYGHRNVEEVRLGARIFTAFPDHQQDWTDPRFGPLFPRYPIDEIAGIILHERLHTHGFEHGTEEDNQCNYTSYECPNAMSMRFVPGACRFNSLNEIAEACMSEVVEASTSWCDYPCPDSAHVPIIDVAPSNSKTGNETCTCTPW